MAKAAFGCRTWSFLKTSLDCISCFIRQALEAVRFVTDDPSIHEKIVRDVLRETAEMDFSQPPPAVGQLIHRSLRQLTGIKDPYRSVKDRFNQMALEMLPALESEISAAQDPLFRALRLAVAGNVIDLGVKGGLGEKEVRSAIEATLDDPFYGDIEDFRRAVFRAQRILYLADNAGEIVFDRLLIERLPVERVSVAVRGTPVLNDATLDDARTAGLCDLVEVIDNGSDAPGTILSDCSDDFRRRFDDSDLIIAKGQGNFETLSDDDSNILFLFKVKCPVIATHVGLPLGTHVASRWQEILAGRESI